MSRDELRQAIEVPTGQASIRFEDGLIDSILDDVGNEPGKSTVAGVCFQDSMAAARP